MSRWPALLALPLAASVAAADPPAPQCHVVDVDITPIDNLQIVAWVEQPDGTFVDTIYVTQKTGLYGLGNRPGRYDFNSGSPQHDQWPYGRRVNTFPVWAHRHGKSWPEIDYQNADDNNLSHPFSQSSLEMQPPYCRPLQPQEPNWDTGTCASQVYTDKGVFSPTKMSLYPPRADVARHDGTDSASVDLYQSMNPFDAITHATPVGGQLTELTWPIPGDLPMGNYVLWLEVSKTYDFNDTYNSTTYPAPTGIPWADYGEPYRGQPSVVYATPFTIGVTESTAMSTDYVGYGDPDGATGTLHPPDATIDATTPGKGASRLMVNIDGTSRVKVTTRPEFDSVPPGTASDVSANDIASSSAVIQFTAPGGDGTVGTVTGYEIRYRAGEEMTADNFDQSTMAATSLVPSPSGSPQTFELDGLLPNTPYWVGIRAYDDCRNISDVAIAQFTTADRMSGEVDACFVATAAYGSLMANDVEMLRHFRDSLLRSTVFGELAIETYYTFGPSVAGVVGESELLRATARAVLAPIVTIVRRLAV